MENRKLREVYSPMLHLPPLYKHVGIYCRVSSGLKEQLDSLSAQASGLVRMVAARGDMRLVDIYIDVTSGEQPGRSEFGRMLADAQSGKLDILLTKSISRFGRNTEDCIIALRELKRCNVQVIFDEEHIDTFKDRQELITTILAASAEADNESRRKNQLWAMKKRLEDGTSELFYRTCYGYRKTEDGVICIDNDEAATVQLIFSAYLGGASIIGIRKLLHEQGMPSPRGNENWSKRSIETVLKNEKYTGSVIARKTMTSREKGHRRVRNETEEMFQMSDIFPVIVTKEIFEAVREEMKRRSNIETDNSGTHRKSTHYSSKAGKNTGENV